MSSALIRRGLLGALCGLVVACGGADAPLDGGEDVAVAEVAPVDTGAPVDTAVAGTECVASGDCKGEVTACQAWACDKGLCFKVAAPDGAICDGGDACHPGVCSVGTCSAKAKVCEQPKDPCKVAACKPETGTCETEDRPDGAACEDGLGCTVQDTCTGGVCKGNDAACPCESDADCPDDGDLCNGLPYCDSGTCKLNVATIVACATSKDTQCAKNTCQPASGKCAIQPVTKGVECDDGSACTKGDICADGACEPGTYICDCKTDADCTDDGDKCNGVPFCNKADGTCLLNPATIVACPTAGNWACQASVCNTGTGVCGPTPVGDGKACDDGNPCTKDEVCDGGACASKTNLCTCSTDADCKAKEDGDLCNGTLFCNKALNSCEVNPSTVVECAESKNPCLEPTCVPKTGSCQAVAKKDGSPCDDGDACSIGDACVQGTCTASGKSPECVCQVDSDCAKFEDADLCNGTLICDKANKKCVLNPLTVVYCFPGDDTACNKNTCDAKTGKCAMQVQPVTLGCDDGQPCTVGDHCDKAGKCAPGEDTCQCGPHLVGFDCDAQLGDGNACNGTLWCNLGKMPFKCEEKPNSKVNCGDDGNPCTTSGCDTKTGTCTKSNKQDGVTCSVVDPCVKAAVCAQGLCVTQVPVNCDDGQPCTQDACDSKSGKCVNTALKDGFGCPLGDPCVQTSHCAAGVCKAVSPVNCDDGKPCTIDACESTSGKCTHTHDKDGKACATGDQCALESACKAGLCAKTKAKNCDDGQPCTVDSCDSATGKCAHVPLQNGYVCSSPDKCVTAAACTSGACTAVKTLSCDDGKACTQDACDSKTGSCTSSPIADGVKCTLKSKCVLSAACDKGACKALQTKDCNDANVCTNDACDPETGLCANQPVTEGTACAVADKCVQSAGCASGACKSNKLKDCADGNACTKDSCDATTGDCVHTPLTAGSPCTNSDKCAAEAQCSSGACQTTKTKSCDDDKPCTSDTCDSSTGCQHKSVPAGFTVSCYTGPKGTLGVGTCTSGTTQCNGFGSGTGCLGEVTPQPIDACGGGNQDCDAALNEDCGVPYKIKALCGGGQKASPGAAPFLDYTVLVTDGSDIPLANTKVTWTSPNGGSFKFKTTTSDSKGVTRNTFYVGPDSGTTYVGRATIEGTKVAVDISTPADKHRPEHALDFPSFCDTTKLALTGVAAYQSNTVRLVTGGDNTRGSMWLTTPLQKGKSFQIKYHVGGYTRGYTLVLQSTSAGTKLPSSGYGDGGTLKYAPAFVVQVTGYKKGSGTLYVRADGKGLIGKGGIVSNSRLYNMVTWVDYDASAKKVSVYIGDAGKAKPKAPVATVIHDVWKTLGSNGQPIYAGFTAANSSGGQNGSKFLYSWSMSVF